MLAQHLDQDTLKTVIMAHAKQKFDSSSSSDSESESESDSEGGDVVSKIFRTVCTIDLCSDDDETLHEDVLQYFNDSEESVAKSVGDPMLASSSSTYKVQEQKIETSPEQPSEVQPILSSEQKPSKLDTAEIADKSLTASTDILGTETVHEELIVEKHSIENISNATETDHNNEIISPTPSNISNILASETQSNKPCTFDDLENHTATFDAVMDVKEIITSPTNDTSKLEEIVGTNVTSMPEKTVLKLRPFEEISSCANLKNAENETSTSQNSSEKFLIEETQAETDSKIVKSKSNRKRSRKVSKPKKAAKKKSKTLIDGNQNSSLLRVTPLESEKTTKIMEEIHNDQIKFSSSSINDDSTAIKIKIKIGKGPETPSIACNDPTPTPVLSDNKSSRSRKRKLEVSKEAAATPTPIENTRKRPIFEYFESPEILTSKRARKSKSYADDEIRYEDQSSNQRTSKRKMNPSKKAEKKSESKVQKIAVKVDDQKEVPSIGVQESIEEIEVSQEKDKLPLAPPKIGRGIRQPVLPPVNIADLYVCGNCKENIVAKNWTKHLKYHYGLAWRVDVDPPIVSL